MIYETHAASEVSPTPASAKCPKKVPKSLLREGNPEEPGQFLELKR